eukprot:gnl/Hemi2/26583_TR8930_c0_g1_i3.p1 gnl/Hemi2/26583_TR8930_c0_g1~~gnl/Hemi2/26583_TR8930_c0_g1_i3.p1  ORF type:complete len:152 (-),score=32.34 gnl/Hemi2/26583_TR8930_c0_g1_i3:160-615(-)
MTGVNPGLQLSGQEVASYVARNRYTTTASVLRYARSFTGWRMVDGQAMVPAREDVLYRIFSAGLPDALRDEGDWHHIEGGGEGEPLLFRVLTLYPEINHPRMGARRGMVSFDMLLHVASACFPPPDLLLYPSDPPHISPPTPGLPEEWRQL